MKREPDPALAAARPQDSDAAALDDLLGAGARRKAWWRGPTPWLIGVVLVALAATLWWWAERQQAAAAPRYDTQVVARGPLSVSVSANGTLAPTNQVNVGSELSGTVARVLVDVNDRVAKGQVLAELDTARLRDQVAKSRAAVEAAQAAVLQAAATVTESQDTLDRLERVWQLSAGQVPSQTELAAARASRERALANVASAKANVAQAQATLSADATNLAKASIRSPISGVVLARSVDPGNAVAASLQAVTLFTLAEDLAQMKLVVNVDEADVGQVREGQRATFTVSAWPTRGYPATITRVGYGSTTKDNVVTYLADLKVDNSDLSLRPGMTATATIRTLERTDALLVPNAALRYTPSAGAAPQGGNSIVSRLLPRPPGGNTPRRAQTDTAQVRQVWVLEQGVPVALPVTPGATDGRMTEVTSEQLQPGMAVIVGMAATPGSK